MDSIFDAQTVKQLNKELPAQMISTRKSGSKALKYIEGHTAIDQANKIFGAGNWSFETLSCEQSILLDPLTGESVGIAYNAVVRLLVRDAIGPVTEVGSQPVAAWSVDEVVQGRRKEGDDIEIRPITLAERIAARRTIVEAHENARKSAVTDAMKRALRAYGSALGNCLYGSGPVLLVEDVKERAEALLPGKWEAIKIKQFKSAIPDERLSSEMLARIARVLEAHEVKREQGLEAQELQIEIAQGIAS